MTSRLPARLTIAAFIPRGAKPRWYHVIAIILLCIPLFFAILGLLLNLVLGSYLNAIWTALFLGFVLFLAYLLRKSIKKTVQPAPVNLPPGFAGHAKQ